MNNINVTNISDGIITYTCYTCGFKTKNAVDVEFNLAEEDIGITLCESCSLKLVDEISECLSEVRR